MIRGLKKKTKKIMTLSLIRSIRNIFSSSVVSVKKSLHEVKDELSLILRNNRYSKSYPNIFAIFSIMEQEQNSRVSQLQKSNFKRIKKNILQDDDVSDSEVLNALRGLFHNNRVTKNASAEKVKISKYIFNKAKKIILEGNDYDEGLARVLVFEFPFILNQSNYAVISSLIRKNSQSCNRVIAEVFLNIDALEFLNNKKDIFQLINLTVTYNNKPVFAIFFRYLRKINNFNGFFAKGMGDLVERLLSEHVLSKKGSEFGSIFLSCLQDKNLSTVNKKHIADFLKAINNLQRTRSTQHKRMKNVMKYLTLSNSLGCQNSQLLKIVSVNIRENYLNSAIKKSKIKLVDDLGVAPNSHISVSSIFGVNTKAPEEYWLINNAPYLL